MFKKITTAIVLMVFLSASYCFGDESSFSIFVTDKHSSNKEEVIGHLLDLQGTWQVDIWKKYPQKETQDGFLFVKMKPEFLRGLLDDHNAKIIWAASDGKFVGYIIMTGIHEFFDLYVNSQVRHFDCLGNQSSLEWYLVWHDVKYIEQIAVSRDMAQAGIGSALMHEAKQLSPNGLVAAVLTLPFSNLASLQFFTKNGFHVAGHLNCIECVQWPAYQTRVFFWMPSFKD